mgnify:CR=1 FL=1
MSVAAMTMMVMRMAVMMVVVVVIMGVGVGMVVIMPVLMAAMMMRMVVMVMMGVAVVIVRAAGMSVFVLMVVIVIVMAVDATVTIGAAFGMEGGVDRYDIGAELDEHVLDDVIPADAQAVAEQFCRQMPVAEVPGEAQQMRLVLAGHLDQRLGRRFDSDDAPVLEQQPVTLLQRHGLGQVEQELGPALRGHGDPAPVPRVEIEHDGVGRRLGPEAGGIDGEGADQASLRSDRLDATAGQA